MEKMSILLWIGSSKKSGKIKWLCRFHYLDPSYGSRWLSVGADSEFSGQNAYDILGVSESSSLSEIKASFHKLAKQTHPDLSHSHSNQRFVAILAAYQILSDSERRAHYDRYLLSQRKVLHKHSTQGSMRYVYKTHDITSTKQMEVVEWLRWYRMAVKEILAENKLATGNSYFDVLEADFYAAIHTAYYGPTIESMDSLPDCFEAEVRSVYETPEVLHLVSGRDLFGMVCLADKTPKLSSPSTLKLKSFEIFGLGLCPSKENVGISIWSNMVKGIRLSERLSGNDGIHSSDAYNDLELHLYGKLVAIATRSHPLNSHNGFPNEGTEDRIKVFLSSEDNSVHIHQGVPNDSTKGRAKTPVATILGLGTTPEEGQCFVYDGNGSKTHLIMKHRTLMVKHMHWYEVTDKVSVCECRCTRARLPPSRFWLFEPRCGMHDIGGWYVETFGKDKKRRTVPSQRFWDGFDGSELYDKRLHPAAYLLALAYRTLDLEDAKRRKRTMKSFVEVQLSRIFHWCKKLV